MQTRSIRILLPVTILILLTTACAAPVSFPTLPTAAPTETAVPAAPETSEPTPDPTAEPTLDPTPSGNTIVKNRYLGDYLSGRELAYDGGLILIDPPGGTGSERVAAYILPDGGEATLLTDCMGIDDAYVSGDWLYFPHADPDAGLYDYRRLNLRDTDEIEPLSISALFATESYFYYYLDWESSALYRRDGDFANETPVFPNVADKWLLRATAHNLIEFHGDYYADGADPTFTVYGEDGAPLYDISPGADVAWMFHDEDDAFYWCDRTDLPGAIRLHRLHLPTGALDPAAEAPLAVEGMVLGVADVDEAYAYVEIHVPETVDSSGMSSHNTHLYRMPLGGGEAVFLRSWFES